MGFENMAGTMNKSIVVHLINVGAGRQFTISPRSIGTCSIIRFYAKLQNDVSANA